MVPKKLILTLLFFVLLAFSASAQDFVAYSTFTQTSTCSCSMFEDIITIHNPSEIPMGYTMRVEGDITKYSSLGNQYIVLMPGETKQIPHVMNLPCDLQETFSYDVIIQENKIVSGDVPVTGNLGIRKVISQKITVDKCNNNQFNFVNGNSFTSHTYAKCMVYMAGL